MIDSDVCAGDWFLREKETIRHILEVAGRKGLSAVFDDGSLSDPHVSSEDTTQLRLQLASDCHSQVVYGVLPVIGNNSRLSDMVFQYSPGNTMFRNARVVGFKLEDRFSTRSSKERVDFFRRLTDLDYKGALVINCEEEKTENPFSTYVYNAFANGFQGRLHFSPLTSGRSVKIIQGLKKKFSRVSCGTTFPYLLLDSHRSDDRLNPRLRSSINRSQLMDCFLSGEIDVLASGHNPVNGISGIASWQDVIGILYERGADMGVVKLATHDNVNRVFGLNINGIYRQQSLTPDCNDKDFYGKDPYAELLRR